MSKTFLILFVLIACFGCQDSFNKDEGEIEEKAFDVENIGNSPEAKEKHSIDKVMSFTLTFPGCSTMWEEGSF